MNNDSNILLIVGLGNPGPKYEDTRHNAGAWFVQEIGDRYQVTLRFENKFKGICGDFILNEHPCRLLLPSTFMNQSGESLIALSNFHKIPMKNLLVAHDELDLSPGTVRLKFDGGHGGHNGLRNIIAHTHTNAFHRLRIGIGHPGESKYVHDFVLNRPSQSERQAIDQAIDQAIAVLPELLNGSIQKAMLKLHSKT